MPRPDWRPTVNRDLADNSRRYVAPLGRKGQEPTPEELSRLEVFYPLCHEKMARGEGLSTEWVAQHTNCSRSIVAAYMRSKGCKRQSQGWKLPQFNKYWRQEFNH